MTVLPWGMIFSSPRLIKAIKIFSGRFKSAMEEFHQLCPGSTRISFNFPSCSSRKEGTLKMMANTMDAAPRRLDHDTSRHCRREEPKGRRIKNTATGLARNVRKSAINNDGNSNSGSRWGKERSPNRKIYTAHRSRIPYQEPWNTAKQAFQICWKSDLL